MPETRHAGRPRTPPPGGSRHPVDVPRLAALDVLKAVRVDGAYANLVLPAVISHYGLEARDAAFTTELASGALRRRGTYDAILAACADRPLGKVEAKVLDALRLGTHQLLAMRVPAHAAISTTVDLVHHKGGSGAAKFANAVLRRVAETDLAEWITRVAPDPEVSPMRYGEVAYSHPRWIVSELHKAVGGAELFEVLAADNEAPKVTLVARPGRSTRAELLADTRGEPTAYSPFGVVLDGGNPASVPAVAEGRAGVQDEGSQLVALLLAQAPLTGPDRVWVDLCAGPGGKAALLAGLAAERGASLLALDRQQHRARLVARTLAGADGVTGIVVADGATPPIALASVDRILVDAPCTGLGALRRRPEARWRRRPDDLLTLVLLQRRLLGAALDLARPGGLVLYATCSPVTAETSEVVTSILQRRTDVVLEDARPALAQVPDCAGVVPGTIQLWPHRHGTDAMYMALFRKA
ncbi:MAG: transcription antitermination factor NusB [Nocardioides sp.]